MFPATSKQGGQSFAMPDTCLTPAPPAPPVPIPYPNLGMPAQATGASTKVKFVNMPALKLDSEIPMSSGDEAGVNGGVVCGQNMGKVTYKMGSMKVQIEGKAAVSLLSMTGHNGANANMPAGPQVAPSQTKVLIA